MIRRSSWSTMVMAMGLTLLLATAVACTAPTQEDQADAYNNQGIAHYQRGEYEEAIADYSEAIRLDPNHAIAHGNRGDVYRELGEPQLGFVICAGDEPGVRSYNPKLGFKRTKVLMNGDELCDHVFYVEG